MELVIIESPWKAASIAEQLRNRKYALRAMKDSVERDEAPYASHLLYTQFLTEENMAERNLGIEMGLQWGKNAAKTVVYQDWGISSGMNIGIRRAIEENRPVEYRNIPYVESSIDTLQALSLEVSEFFGIKLKDMQNDCRREEVVSARYVYFKVARQLFIGVSFKAIGSIVRHDHSSVIHGIRTLELKYHYTYAYDRFCKEKQLNFDFLPCRLDPNV